MRRVFTLFITPIIGVVILSLHLPEVEKWLSIEFPSPNTDLYIVLSFVTLGLINHWITVYSPFKKYERINRGKWYILNLLIKKLNKDYNKHGISFNLMIPKRCLFSAIEVKSTKNGKEIRRWKIFCRVFEFVWESNNSNINKNLKISVNQGVAGEVFKTGKGLVHNFSNDNRYGLNQEQLILTKDLKLVVSMPVREDDHENPHKKTNKIIGVINAESEAKSSCEYFKNDSKRNELTEDLLLLSNICKLYLNL